MARVLRTEVLTRVAAINVGLDLFADALRSQGTELAEVQWRPPAGGDPDTVRALERLWGRHGERVAQANDEAVRRIEATSPAAVAVARAGDVLEVLEGRTLLHSGPRSSSGASAIPSAGR